VGSSERKRNLARKREQTCEGITETPGAPSEKRRRKRYRHTRDKRPTSRRPRSRDGNPSKLRRQKGPDQATRLVSAGSGTPTAERRRRMTRGAGDAERCSDASNEGASRSKRAATIRAESIGPTPLKRKPQGSAGRLRKRGWTTAARRHRAKEARTSGERSKRDRRCDGIARHNAT